MRTFALVVFILPFFACAREVTVGQLPSPLYLDTEVSTNIAFQVEGENFNRLEFTLGFEASASNSVEAAIKSLLPRITSDGILTNDTSFGWMDGLVQWNIPLGWGEKNSSGALEPYKNFAEDTKSEMRLFSNGQSGVRKFQHQITRYIDGRIFLDMKEIK